MTGRKLLTVLIAMTIVVAVASCSDRDERTPGATSSPGPSIPVGKSDEKAPEVPPEATAEVNVPVAPVFSVASIDGEVIRLEDLLGTAPVYLVFVPSVDGEMDRAQVSAIQSRYAEFEELEAVIVAVATDLPTEVVRLRDELGLEFPLIADPLNVIATEWQVFDLFGDGCGGPASFVFDAHGTLIARLIAGGPDDRPSVDEVLRAIRESVNLGAA
ncbi:MAG: redoxin domain-containing protein [Dehalococcoidia bacterium]|nr:redoxin domain-containing protein [Dehalococcoidia bacterium]